MHARLASATGASTSGRGAGGLVAAPGAASRRGRRPAVDAAATAAAVAPKQGRTTPLPRLHPPAPHHLRRLTVAGAGPAGGGVGSKKKSTGGEEVRGEREERREIGRAHV